MAPSSAPCPLRSERIRAVSKEDVLSAARKYIRPDNMQVIVLGEDAFELEYSWPDNDLS